MEPRDPTQGGDDPGVEAAATDGGVALVDGGVPGRVEPGQGCADRDGLAGADLAGDHAQGPFADTPADPGDGLGVAGVAVQHLGGQGLTERHAGQTVFSELDREVVWDQSCPVRSGGGIALSGFRVCGLIRLARGGDAEVDEVAVSYT